MAFIYFSINRYNLPSHLPGNAWSLWQMYVVLSEKPLFYLEKDLLRYTLTMNSAFLCRSVLILSGFAWFPRHFGEKVVNSLLECYRVPILYPAKAIIWWFAPSVWIVMSFTDCLPQGSVKIRSDTKCKCFLRLFVMLDNCMKITKFAC